MRFTQQLFLSTPSARRATAVPRKKAPQGGDFYPRPPRGGRRCACLSLHFTIQISIHALREEGDCTQRRWARPGAHFYPRPPRGGRRLALEYGTIITRNFYPRPPRGGRPTQSVHDMLIRHFYPRPPRGGRRKGKKTLDDVPEFLSTPSARRATYWASSLWKWSRISIHALREEGDRSRRR